MTLAQNQDTIVYKPTLARLVLLLTGSIAFVFAASWVTTLQNISTLKWFIGGPFGVVFFSFCAAIVALRLLAGTPSLIVTPRGLELPRLIGGTYELPWSEISECTITTHRGGGMLVIALRDEAATAQRVGLSLQLFSWLNKMASGYPIGIAQQAIPVPLDQVLADINRVASTHAPGAQSV